MQPGLSVTNAQLNLENHILSEMMLRLSFLCALPSYSLVDFLRCPILPFSAFCLSSQTNMYPAIPVFSLLFTLGFFLITETVFGFFQKIDLEYLHGFLYV